MVFLNVKQDAGKNPDLLPVDDLAVHGNVVEAALDSECLHVLRGQAASNLLLLR